MQDYLQLFADWVTYTILGLVQGSPLASSVNFFVYDTIKVTLMLAVIVFAVAIVRTYITPQKVKKWVAGRTEGVGNVLAALLGIPTPFCSCSAVPLFIGFVEIRRTARHHLLVPDRITAHQRDCRRHAACHVRLADRAHLHRLRSHHRDRRRYHHRAPPSRRARSRSLSGSARCTTRPEKPMTWQDRIDFGISESKSITLKVLPYIIIGIAIGAIIHGYAPADFLVNIAGPDNPLAVPIAVLIGIPLYSNAAGMIPIMEVLTAKGMAMGTALAFMMAVIGLSLPEMIILRKVIKIKLLAIFAGILFVSFTLTGYLFNAILG